MLVSGVTKNIRAPCKVGYRAPPDITKDCKTITYGLAPHDVGVAGVWCSTIADLVHFQKLVSHFRVAPYWRIPITAGNFEAQFRLLREAPEL
ncbi:hypothetical protein TNCV_1224901 [Trichonephila clavipes]|nr:hypothetical protein TNCV_1224901 [Trichonephila clavipes]